MQPYYQPESYRFRIIATKIHGVFDYVIAVALLLAPTLFGFEDLGGAAVWVPRVLGIGIMVMSLLTRYELGVVNVIPMTTHLFIDIAAASFLTLSPFIFGFSSTPDNMWVPHIVFGIAYLTVALLTQTHPYVPQVPVGAERRTDPDTNDHD
ncbi:MAG: hypothetical protein MUF38_18795 [Anaerolineae bacterium]|jgi:hypothetical protein|nr:hypothetical protein [Anaerolineae bacterium]